MYNKILDILIDVLIEAIRIVHRHEHCHEKGIECFCDVKKEVKNMINRKLKI